MSDTDAKVAKLKADLAAQANADRAKQSAAAKKASSKSPRTDAEIIGKNPESPKTLGKKAMNRSSTKVSAGSPAAPKTIAQSVAEVQPELPTKPLAGQGSMVGKPVEQITDKRGALIERRPGGKPPAGIAERRAAPAAAEPAPVLDSPKVMTTAGSVESTAPKAAVSAAPDFSAMRESVKRGFGGVEPTIEEGVKTAYQASTKMGSRVGKSLAEKAGSALGSGLKWSGTAVGKAAVGIAKGIVSPITDPIKEFRAGSAARKTAYEAAGSFGKKIESANTAIAGGFALGKIGVGLGKAAAEGLALEGAWTGGREAAREIQEGQSDIQRKASNARKYNLSVTAPGYNESMIRAFTGGSPKIKVAEIDQSLGVQRVAQGEAKMQANKSTVPASEDYSDAEYKKLKSTAGRTPIKGSYKD